MNEFQREYLGGWKLSERDIRLHELATRYHTECEAYDRTVCTGPILENGIMPATDYEWAAINRNALAVRKQILTDAELQGFTKQEIVNAISKWRKA